MIYNELLNCYAFLNGMCNNCGRCNAVYNDLTKNNNKTNEEDD